MTVSAHCLRLPLAEVHVFTRSTVPLVEVHEAFFFFCVCVCVCDL
jgi:hypothetical protein